ncbi:MLO-like protein 4 [Acorus calamus]|uniref:MLO-like protein 4 n=1 Tax=Acorus calamus TaxID=4465 RepID=A0AAV9DFU1_ACOCL|nr:MLO-like protein 4 [Acorus calamus]
MANTLYILSVGVEHAIMPTEEPPIDCHSFDFWMGSKFKKALIAESVRESLHSWCKRVKEKSKRDSLNSHLTATRSVCSLESTIDERDETTTIDTVTSSESPSTSPRVSVSFNGDAADSANRLTFNGVSHAP